MKPSFKAFLATCMFLGVACLSQAAFAQTALPDGKGKAEFVQNCTACHTARLVTRNKKTPEEWKVNVREMAARGTDGTPEDLNNVVLYLVANFATDKPSTPATTPPSTPAMPNATEIERAKHVIAGNGCLACHRIENQGASTGPSLNGLATRRTPDQIRAAIVGPHPTLDAAKSQASAAQPYKDKITGEDMESLLRYLGSLPAVDENKEK